MEHEWPEPGEHLFGPWLNKDRKTKYRVCLHPDCHEVETIDVSGV